MRSLAFSNMNDKIPQDILRKIEQQYADTGEKKAVLKIIHELFDKNWGVGHDQLARSLLVLSDGNLIELETAISSTDPRDIIMIAEVRSGNPGHYFIPTFDEMESTG